MTDILDLIDNATEQLCACGCRADLDPDGPSAWFASQECQRRWGDAQTVDPQDVYSRPDAGHEPPARPGRAGPTCRNCEQPIRRLERSHTGWTHGVEWGDWEGVRCPGRVTGAVPVERACGHLLCAGLPYCRESPGLVRLREVAEHLPEQAYIGTSEGTVQMQWATPRLLNATTTLEAASEAISAQVTTNMYGRQRVTVGPAWLLAAFPDVHEWERRGAMWRGQSSGMFQRDTWLYVLRDGENYVSSEVTCELLASCRVDAEGLVEETLRGAIEEQRAAG